MDDVPISTWLRETIGVLDCPMSALAEKLGYRTPQPIYNWLDGRSKPPPSVLLLLQSWRRLAELRNSLKEILP